MAAGRFDVISNAEPASEPIQPGLLTWRWRGLLALALLGTLGTSHVAAFLDQAQLLHGANLLKALERINRGQIWVESPMFGDSGLSIGGPLYYWLYTPGRLVDNPVLGVHLVYFGLEAAALLLWVLLARRAVVREEVAWIGALLLAGSWLPKITLAENSTMAGFLVTASFGVLSAALARPRVGWMAAAGLLLGAAVQVHPAAAMALPAAVVAVIAAGGPRLRRAVELALGLLLPMVLLYWGFYLDAAPDGGTRGQIPVPGDTKGAHGELEVCWYLLRQLSPQVLVLVGAGVAVSSVGGGRRRCAGLLLLTWLVVACPATLLAASQAYLHGLHTIQDRVDRILALLGPLLTCLEAGALWWIFGAGGVLQRRFRLARVPPTWLLGVVAGATLAWGGAQLWGAARSMPRERPLQRYIRHLQTQERSSRAGYWYLQRLLDAGLKDTGVDAGQFCSASWSAEWVLQWPLAIPGQARDDVMVFPELQGIKLQDVRGARHAAPMVLLTGLAKVPTTMSEGGMQRLRWPEGLKASGLVLAIIGGTSRGRAPSIRLPGTRTVASRTMAMRHPSNRFVQWRVLQVEARHPQPGKQLTLEITPRDARVERLCLSYVLTHRPAGGGAPSAQATDGRAHQPQRRSSQP